MRDSLVFPLVLLLLASCAQRVLGVPRGEAEDKLRSGNIEFVAAAPPGRMKEVLRVDPAAPFFTALLLEDYYKTKKSLQSDKKNEEKRIEQLLAEALKSPLTRAAAANRIIPRDIDFYFEDSQKKNPVSLASKAEGSDWSEPFALLKEAGAVMDGTELRAVQKKLRPYFLERNYENAPAKRRAAEWLVRRIQKLNTQPLSAFDINAAHVRLAAARREYGTAKWHLNVILNGANASVLNNCRFFIEYPETLNDAGRAFLYGAAINDGITIFSQYDAALRGFVNEGKIKKEEAAPVRYLLNYYQGRFYRSLKNSAKAEAMFTDALLFAPDNEQKDACIWYLIDIQYAQKPENAVPIIKKYAGRWNNASYFDDILDKFIFYCSSKKKWQNLIDIYPALEHNASEKMRAKYAYIIARALEEKYASGRTAGLNPKTLLNAAYEQEADYYYRAMAAARLGKNPAIIHLDEAADAQDDADLPERTRFLLLFFRFGCVRFVTAYISEYYEALTVPELRRLAREYAEMGRYGDAIRLVVKYSKRPGFIPSRADLELSYPRAFSELVELYAKKTKMKENYLYALMRTESIFIPDIVSRAGALGLTQLMPATGRQMAEILAGNGGPNYIKNNEINLLDPELNIHLGALYYKDMEMRMGSTQTALMAYNGGIGRVRRWQQASRNMPDDLFAETIEIAETREYSKKVIGDAAVYQSLYY
ncbi:MAG: lytic transglycosylase domain-containing protein [Spirochaetaceae bacterium]|nr:lytic transglycosylase domain-containing protein [Spirochaetaceae bacterium]